MVMVPAPFAHRYSSRWWIFPDESKLREICTGLRLSDTMANAVALAGTLFAGGVVTPWIAFVGAHESGAAFLDRNLRPNNIAPSRLLRSNTPIGKKQWENR